MSHGVQQVYVHVVWATKQRAPLLTEAVRKLAWSTIRLGAEAAGAKVISVGGVADHVHLLILLPSAVALATVVKRAKGATSRQLNQTIGDGAFAWQEGYAAFSVDRTGIPAVRTCIEGQEAHHAAQTLRDDWESHDMLDPSLCG